MSNYYPTMLGVLAMALVLGCASPASQQSRLMNSVAENSPRDAVRKAAEAEYGPEVADDLPDLTPPRTPMIDPGAKHLVRAIADRLVDRRDGRAHSVLIDVSPLRNLSRCTSREFQELQNRLADLFTNAGTDLGIVFVSDASENADFALAGSAYIVTADGFDQWELYLTLQHAGNEWVFWEAPGAVRVLRQPRPNQPQVLLSSQW